MRILLFSNPLNNLFIYLFIYLVITLLIKILGSCFIYLIKQSTSQRTNILFPKQTKSSANKQLSINKTNKTSHPQIDKYLHNHISPTVTSTNFPSRSTVNTISFPENIIILFKSSVCVIVWLFTFVIMSPINSLLANGLTGVTLAIAKPSRYYNAAADIPKYNWSFCNFYILFNTFQQSPQATILINPLSLSLPMDVIIPAALPLAITSPPTSPLPSTIPNPDCLLTIYPSLILKKVRFCTTWTGVIGIR